MESVTTNRRSFLAAGAVLIPTIPTILADQPNQRLTVGVMGAGGRGSFLAQAFAKQPNVRVAYACDVDATRAGKLAETLKAAGQDAQPIGDFRKMLDDKSVDVLVNATCNHWHAPASILACAAGKHVYVEKPCSHTPWEGEQLVAAARKFDRKVQMGNQRRSHAGIRRGIQALHDGIIGRVYAAQTWYSNTRGTIGRGNEVAVPQTLDWELWQGPAPRKPYRDNYHPYNWHWFWTWGNGELGNNGVHMIDICRWGLAVDYPIRVSSTGGRYRFEDDQETPDTNIVAYDFPQRKSILWTGYSCNRYVPDIPGAEEIFRGENGTLVMTGTGYIAFDAKNKEIKRDTDKADDAAHIADFLAGIRDGQPLNSEILEGHKSTLLCHLGNISYRVGRTLNIDPKTGRILNDSQADALWTKEYAKGFEPKI